MCLHMPPAAAQPTAITVGNFDGVHLGHIALIQRARELVGSAGKIIALSFDPHPSSVLRPGTEPARLTTFAQRSHLLRAAGVDEVHQLQPTPQFLNLNPKEFIEHVISNWKPTVFVEGPDFHFAKARSGTIPILRQFGAAMNFHVEIVKSIEVDLDDQLIVTASSTRIRWLLNHGRVSDAARILGRPYQIQATVVQGDRRGRTIGIPTANISTDQLLPADGIYGGLAQLEDGRSFIAAINIGTRPTFNGIGRRMEVHLMHAPKTGDTIAGLPEYGWNLKIDITHWIREDLKFSGLTPLVEQIHRDCARIEQLCTTMKAHA